MTKKLHTEVVVASKPFQVATYIFSTYLDTFNIFHMGGISTSVLFQVEAESKLAKNFF